MIWSARCNWRWFTRRWPTAASLTTRGWSKNVVGTDGKPILNEKGKPVISQSRRCTAICVLISEPEQIELARRGLWKVVNEEAGPAGERDCPMSSVAGKTGTAQAMTDGKSDTIAWFACFAPYDQPKYAVAVMVQGGEGTAARSRRRSRTGFWSAFSRWSRENLIRRSPGWRRRRKPNPFQLTNRSTFKDSGVGWTDAKMKTTRVTRKAPMSQLAAAGAAPDVEPEADARRQGARRRRAPCAVATPPPRKPTFSKDFLAPPEADASPPNATATTRAGAQIINDLIETERP